MLIKKCMYKAHPAKMYTNSLPIKDRERHIDKESVKKEKKASKNNIPPPPPQAPFGSKINT